MSAAQANDQAGAMRRSHLSTERERRQALKDADANLRRSGLTQSPEGAPLVEAWVQGELSEDQVIMLWQVMHRSTNPTVVHRGTLDRIRAAIAEELDADELDDGEFHLFMALFADYLMKPNSESDALAVKMLSEGGYVGDDDQGRLVRTLPGGGVERIDEALRSNP